MNISILCTDANHPVNDWLYEWRKVHENDHSIAIERQSRRLEGGDILFLVSCLEIIRKPLRDRYRHSLVLHASALPSGRGMSPHIWQILEGKQNITLSLLNAEDNVDTGNIWQQKQLSLEGHELFNEINGLVFDAQLQLMSWAVANIEHSQPWPQFGDCSYYRKRLPEDSRLDINMNICDQFNLLRVADPNRYPAFFEHFGFRYKMVIEKI